MLIRSVSISVSIQLSFKCKKKQALILKLKCFKLKYNLFPFCMFKQYNFYNFWINLRLIKNVTLIISRKVIFRKLRNHLKIFYLLQI